MISKRAKEQEGRPEFLLGGKKSIFDPLYRLNLFPQALVKFRLVFLCLGSKAKLNIH
jgi:hypothetical protein